MERVKSKTMKHLKRLGIGLEFFGLIAAATGVVILVVAFPWIGIPTFLILVAYCVGCGLEEQ
jgi:hypothetical protein